MTTAYIYALTEPSDGRIRYIGKSKDPEERLKAHVREARRGDRPVHRWIREVGKPGLVVLMECGEDWEADEIAQIAKHRAEGCDLLNVAIGGLNPFCPPEVRSENGRKASIARAETDAKERHYLLVTRLGMLLKHGHVRPETRQKMRDLMARRPGVYKAWAKQLGVRA